ncbi:MAG: alpha/beta hydrolase [Lachnospiraceae bacterium]|nr:alpha/beta hydrolase [Lachnospiraceae bacterium]
MKTMIQTVTTDHFQMRYFRFGTAGKQTMVILPGLSVKSVMDSADAVVAAYQLAAPDYDIYLFDRRSDLPSVYSIHDMAEDTAAAMKALGLRDVCLFGVSQGGMISQIIAIEHPELVKALVLASTTAKVSETARAGMETWLPLAKAGDAKGLTEAFMHLLYSEQMLANNQDVITSLSEGVTAEDMARFSILAKAAENFDILDRLGKVQCPVLVLGARQDRVLGPDASEELARALGCESYIYEEYGHAVYDEAPDFLARVCAFFGKVY